MFMAIAVALLVIAVAVFAQGIHELVLSRSALFIVVRTIVARLEGGGFQVQPFLVIGIISATRDILTVGAEVSLTGAQTPAGLHHDGTGGQRGRGARAVDRAGSGAAPGQAGSRLIATYPRRYSPRRGVGGGQN